MTDPLGQSQVLPYLCGLSPKGYQFHLISFEKADRYRHQKTHIAAICAENDIVWHPLFYTKKPPVLSTLWDLWQMRQLAVKLHRQQTFDAVHCRSYLPALIGFFLKKTYNIKFIFDMRGFWADERVDGNLWNLKNPLYKLIYNYFKRKETSFLENADATVSLTEAGKREIEKWKLKLPNIYVIPCCVDTQLFCPDQIADSTRQNLRKQLGIGPDSFVLGYLGSIGTWYMINEMLDFFKILLKRRPNTTFLFVTNETALVLEKAMEKNISPTSIVVISTTRKNVPAYISLFDFSIFFIKPSYSKISSSPVKQGEIMAMGIPIIANTKVGDTDTLLTCDTGILIHHFADKDYEEAVVQMPHMRFDSSYIRQQALRHFDLDSGISKYWQIYKDIFIGHPAI